MVYNNLRNFLGGFIIEQYLYNEGTGTLHIKGFCCHSKFISLPDNYKCFDTEQEAYNYAGRKIKPCITCQNKKEKLLKGE